jgi:hypothetical protein
MTVPKPGDFAVVSAGGYAGRLVQIGEWLNGAGAFDVYQHAFIYTGLPGDKAVIQAEPGGAGYAPLTVHAKTLWSTGHFDLTTGQREAIVQAAIGYIGTPYSWLDYFALAAHRFHIPAPHLRAFIKATGSMICSQYVDRCWQAGGVQIFADGRWNGDVTPPDLARRLS